MACIVLNVKERERLPESRETGTYRRKVSNIGDAVKVIR